MDRQTEAAIKRAIGMLDAILNRQIVLHREMLRIAEDKHDSILSGNLEKLEKAVIEEKALIGKIEEEEEKRLAVLPLLRNHLKLDNSVEKLADVISHMPEPERSHMLKVREQLREVLEICQIKTRRNAELLKASLEHVESFLRTIAEAAKPDANYGKNGKRASGGAAFIDRSA